MSICACSSSNISGLISSNLTVITLFLRLLFIYNSDNNLLLCVELSILLSVVCCVVLKYSIGGLTYPIILIVSPG